MPDTTFLGSFTIDGSEFKIRAIPSGPNAITGIRLGNESNATLGLNWGNGTKLLYPATMDVISVGSGGVWNDIDVTALTSFGGSPQGELLVELAIAPYVWPGGYPMSLPPSVVTATAISGNVNVTNPVNINGDVPVLNAPGSSLATTRDQYQLGNFTAGPAGITNRTVNIDSDTHAIGLLISGSGAPPLVQINGGVTGTSYLTQTLPGGAPIEVYLLCPVASAYDNSIEISINNGDAIHPLEVYVIGDRNPQVIQIIPGVSTWTAALPIEIQDNAGQAAVIDTQSPVGYALAVSLRQSVAAPWAKPQFYSVITSSATSGNVRLLNALASSRYYLHQWQFTPATNGAFLAQFQDDTTSPMALVNNSGVAMTTGDGKGIASGIGQGVVLNIAAMPTGTWRLAFGYSIGNSGQ